MTATLTKSTRPVASAPRSAAPNKPQGVLSTLNTDGSRRWLKPRLSQGRFLSARRMVAWALIAIFALLPYLSINGKPVMLLDIAARRFHVLGATFLPTDTVLLALLLVGTFIAVFLGTALAGRLWCGWACPQTVYMEFVFRPIERLFDGTQTRSGRGDFQGSGFAKVCKYTAYLAVSVFLAHTFLAYFVGVEQLAQWVRRSPFEHPAGFMIVASTTALMLFDFCLFREQTCILACPYGRFQSVMLDRQSLVISYDVGRGEPRGKKRRTTSDDSRLTNGIEVSVALPVLTESAARSSIVSRQSSSGDCIDCFMCVTTCPTGIDIRDGLQMECIGCAQCIDACDSVMDKIGESRGLIRYSSQSTMAGEVRRLLRPRVIIYSLALVVVVSLFSLALARRGDAYVTLLRGLGSTFTELPPGEIANSVRVKVVNRTNATRTYAIDVEGVTGARVRLDGSEMIVQGGQTITVGATIIAPFEAFAQSTCPVIIIVRDNADFVERLPWQLMGPGSRAGPSPVDSEHSK